MKTIWVLQHSEAEYLGLIEEHLEGRNLRFRYFRPFAAGGIVPGEIGTADGLFLLGGGPYGVVSGHLLPSLGAELRQTAAMLAAGRPVLRFGLGAVILAVAAGGGAGEAPLRFDLKLGEKIDWIDAAPQPLPMVHYLRDAPILPATARPIYRDEMGEALAFATHENSLGFLGHLGMKRGMAEDLIMEFEETPADTLTGLAALNAAQTDIAQALTPLMVAIVRHCGWM